MDNKLKLTCPCHFGLESVLKYEVNKIGGENITVRDGRVSFEGGFDMIARANICLSTAERVLIELAEFRAVTFEELFQGVKKIPLENFIGIRDAFPVKGHSLNSALHSIPDCQSIIKKAAVERLKDKYHTGWFEETGAVHQIQFRTSQKRLPQKRQRGSYKGNACGGNYRLRKDKRLKHSVRSSLRQRNIPYRISDKGSEYTAVH